MLIESLDMGFIWSKSKWDTQNKFIKTKNLKLTYHKFCAEHLKYLTLNDYPCICKTYGLVVLPAKVSLAMRISYVYIFFYLFI